MQDSPGVAKPRARLSGRYVLSPHTKDIEAAKESARRRAERAETESLVDAFMEYQQGSLVDAPCSGKQQILHCSSSSWRQELTACKAKEPMQGI
ncbi:uncharacterized protein TrAFT101_008812 [Trichoderma asperellum]|uniref:uncharacterized protein n=1 Tax=Trichoderma asperellum TaxID=101201 RepID=UPI003321E15F|nr:hypothetical protein TrAFT101_008812 [Trichoderma asperellum]